MKQKTGRKLFAFLLSLALLLGLLPGMSLTAYAAAAYNLWVGGVQVTSDNLIIDNSDSTAINGSATYDPEAHTLTLENFSYTGPGHSDGEEGGGIDCREGNLTIVLVGNNSITKKDDSDIDYSHGIYFHGSTLTMEGEGSLDISFAADRNGGKSNGIFCEPGTFVMNSGTVVSNAGVGAESAGIFTSSGITFNGGNFSGIGNKTAESSPDWGPFESRGIYSNGIITVNGGTVYGSAPLDNGRSAYAFHNKGYYVTINGGDVTAYGKTAFWAARYVKAGEGKTIYITAGENESSAVQVNEIPENAKYVHISTESPSAII